MSLEGTISRPWPSPFPTRPKSIALIKNQRVRNLALQIAGEIATSRVVWQVRVVASATSGHQLSWVAWSRLPARPREQAGGVSKVPSASPASLINPLTMLQGAKRRHTDAATEHRCAAPLVP